MPPKRKRSSTASSSAPKKPAAAKKRAKVGKAVTAGASRLTPIKEDPDQTPKHSNVDQDKLRERFIALFSDPKHEVSNKALKAQFGDEYLQLVPIINELTRESRLAMSKVGDELFYTLVSHEEASKFAGLDLTARMVYQVIEKAGNLGIWTKEIRTQTNIQQQALNKIFKVRGNDALVMKSG